MISSRFDPVNQAAVSLNIDGHVLAPAPYVKDLGVILDSSLSMDQHIMNVCKVSYFHLQNIRYLKPVLSLDALLKVTHAFICSRLDYCNSLLYGLQGVQLAKLQRIQNIAARLVTGCSRYDHITPVLKKLHWLPVRERIDFKVLLMTYRSINGLGPLYISELLMVKKYSRSLRSSSEINLVVPNCRLKSYGDNAFAVAAPKLWNTLPSHIKSSETVAIFKSRLKTFLFRRAFNNV